MFGFTTQAAMDRALERQARAHRQHVQELHDKISRLQDERDSLNIQLDTRNQINGKRRLRTAGERLEQYMNRPDEEAHLTMAQWSEAHG